MSRLHLFLCIGAIMALYGCGHSSERGDQPATAVRVSLANPANPAEGHIASAIASAARLPGDADQDVWRNPEALLQFLGVRPGMRVIDFFAGDGYYTELLARAVEQRGTVIAYNNTAYAKYSEPRLTERFRNNRLPNAHRLDQETSELKLESSSLDAAVFVMAYHDLYWKPADASVPFGDPAAVLAKLYGALRPGGVVVVQDHIANPGGDAAQVVDVLHRIDPEVVQRDFARAGFVLDGKSDAWRHEDDDHTKPSSDPSVRHMTDQFVFRYKKPDTVAAVGG
jgi:predicted methyltransferase